MALLGGQQRHKQRKKGRPAKKLNGLTQSPGSNRCAEATLREVMDKQCQHAAAHAI
ncbi:hypothetical protein [Sinorhizobium sojae]|uniref:hypothetical protein n=1 Tax=Sinorhizobium sojae TaxID=716925 RepID=UPI0012F72C79|nr:hypothetical protein [Sinorhizobium sojae]